MKSLTKTLTRNRILLVCISIFIFSACQKQVDKPATQEEIASAANQNKEQGHLKQTKEYSSEVATKWLDLQLRILRIPAGGANVFGLNSSRYFAYCGIALYESVVPGMPAYQSLSDQLTAMPDMPNTSPGTAYHWPTCANAALAYINKNFFSFTSSANVQSMDSLENALNLVYQTEVNAATFNRSVDFGKAVAQLIFNWSTTDGSLTFYPPYVPPVGPGLWAATPPAFLAAAGPYWGNNRLFVQGSLNGTDPAVPPPYSADPASPYYAMVKEVYDVSQTLTPEQTAIGLYYRDAPGYVGGSHYISIFKQVLASKQPQLDIAALAYAKAGIASAEAFIACWKTKYIYNVERPIKYIREVLNHPTWNALFNTPQHPDFPSGHSTNGGAVAEMLTNVFGDFTFTNHTYDYLGMAPRTYQSFSEMANEVGRSRVYAGIHYTWSCEKGTLQGKKIAQNILDKVKFLKE